MLVGKEGAHRSWGTFRPEHASGVAGVCAGPTDRGTCCCSGFVLARAARLTSCRLARTGAGGGVGWTIHLPAGNTQFGSCLVDRCHPTATPALASIVRTLGQAPDDLSLPQHPIPPRGGHRQVPIRPEGNRLFVAHSSPPG